MRVLVTGGAGFIGSFVVDQLEADGHEVVVIDNLDPSSHGAEPWYLSSSARYVWADVADPASWRSALGDVDAIAHLAGKVGLGVDFSDAAEYVAHNDVGTVTGLTELHRVGWDGRLVLASSMVVYGEGQYRCAEHGNVRPGPRHPDTMRAGDFEPPCPICGASLVAEEVTEEVPPWPRNVYAATKLHQEHLCDVWATTTGRPVPFLRFHNVYGPRMPQKTPYAGVASIIASALRAGDRPKVFEDGHQRRDFIHVTDVAAAVVAALVAPQPVGGPFNVASGEPHSVLDMAEAMAAAVDPDLTPDVVGGWREGDVRHVFASPQRLIDSLDWVPSVPFADGMAEMAEARLRVPPARV